MAALLVAVVGAALVAHAAALSAIHQVALQNNATSLRPNKRMMTCQYCKAKCPISCFAGPCPVDFTNMPHLVKIPFNNWCYSCDPAMSVGISRDNDLNICKAPPAPPGGAVKGKLSSDVSMDAVSQGGDSPYKQQQGLADGPQGPAVPGDGDTNIQKSLEWAKKANEAALKGAELTKKAAGVDKDESMVQGENKDQAGSWLRKVKSAGDPELEAQMEADNALKKSELTHAKWKLALGVYNTEVSKLRRMQLVTAAYEREMETARQMSQEARSAFATLQQAQADAKAAMNAMGGSAGASIEAQFAAEEMAGAANAGHRRLLVAAGAAKDAWRKLGSVTSKWGGVRGAEKPKPKVKPTEAPEAPPKPEKEAPPPAPPRVFAVEPGDAAMISTRASLTPRSSLPLEDTPAEQSSFQSRNIEQEMTQNLQEQLAANPASVEDARLFEPPALPQFSKDIPLSLGSFDTTVAADAPMV